MVALLAYAITASIVLLFLLINQVTGLFLEDIFYSRRPFRENISWVTYTVFYVTVIYTLTYIVAKILFKRSEELDNVGSRPRRMDDALAFNERLRWDYGRWPIYLIAIVVGVSIITVPGLALRLVHPVVWIFFVLLAPTLFLIWRGREPQPIPQMPASRHQIETHSSPPRSVDQVIEHLRQHPRYRGQLRASLPLNPSRADSDLEPINRPWEEALHPGGLLHSALASLNIDGPFGLYAHQRDALERLLTDPDDDTQLHHVVLSTGPGSGRHVTLFLTMLDRTLRRGAHVLVVTPDDETLTHEYQRFRELADHTDWHYAIHEARIVRDDTVGIPDPPPEIVFCSLATLHERVLRDARLWTEFFDGLEVIVALDVDRYTGIHGANAAQVFRRLRLVTGMQRRMLQYVATAHPSENTASFVSALFGLTTTSDRVHVFSLDTSPRPQQMLGVWLPPLDRVSSFEENGHQKREIRRQEPPDAVIDLAEMLLSIPGYRLLVHCYQWGELEVDTLSNGIDQAVQTTLTERRLRITTDESQLSGRQAEYDGLIVLGTPSHVDELERLCGMLGQARAGGIALVLASHSPAAMRMIRSFQAAAPTSGRQALYDQLRRILPIGVRHRQVVEKHLRCAAGETPLRESEIRLAFGIIGVDIAEGWVQAGRATWEIVVGDAASATSEDRILTLVDDMREQAWDDCHLDTLSGEPAKLIPVRSAADGLPYRWIDRHREAIELYPRRVMTISQKPMVLARDDAGDYYADLPRGAALFTMSVSPRHASAAVLAHGQTPELPLTSRVDNGAPYRIARKHVQLAQTILAVRESGRDGVAVQPDPQQVSVSFTADAIILIGDLDDAPMSEDVAHTLAHGLRVALRLALPKSVSRTDFQVLDVPRIDGLVDRPCVIICDSIDGGLGFADTVFVDFTRLLRDAYRILVNCPCQNGCPACIEDADCTHWGDDGTCTAMLDKRATLLYLGAILGNSSSRIAGMTPDQLDRVRYHAVTDPNDLITIRERVFGYGLTPLLGPEVAPLDRASIRFMTKTELERLGAGVLGFYSVQRNEVAVQPLTEDALVGVIAHEYAHDWQYSMSANGTRNMHPAVVDPAIVPWNGQLLSEGFAQWTELRVLDAYGFKRNLDDINFRFYDNYGEGFQIVKSVEDEHGVAGIMTLMGSILDQRQLRELLRKANTTDRVNAIGRQLEEGEIEMPPPDVIELPQPLPSQPDTADEVSVPNGLASDGVSTGGGRTTVDGTNDSTATTGENIGSSIVNGITDDSTTFSAVPYGEASKVSLNVDGTKGNVQSSGSVQSDGREAIDQTGTDDPTIQHRRHRTGKKRL